jgi:hypothetical protein
MAAPGAAEDLAEAHEIWGTRAFGSFAGPGGPGRGRGAVWPAGVLIPALSVFSVGHLDATLTEGERVKG